MSDYYIFQDQKKCIGCQACMVACKSRQELPTGPFPCMLVAVGPKQVRNRFRIAFTFMPCFHCEKPWCVAACPTGAMGRQEEDGIVEVSNDLCVGCKACMSACPWSAPQWNPETRKVAKCDLCRDRIADNEKPACVTVCPTGCLHFGTPEEIPDIRRERYARARSSDFPDETDEAAIK